jgi:hypothetical protein
MRNRRLLQAITPLVAMLSGYSCLPADTRPEPAQINWQASLAAGRETISTDDGWTIAIDRLFVGLGRGRVDDDCIDYSDSRYDRLLDLSHSGDQKLSTEFALGKCAVRFRMSGPSPDTVLGAGVTETDKLLLGMYSSDDVVSSPAPIALDVLATAQRGETIERLHWSFRQTVRYKDCNGVGAEGGPATRLDFESGAKIDLHLDAHPEVLFRSENAPSAGLRFDPIAAADVTSGNADGWVTLDELGRVPFTGGLPEGLDPSEIVTLEDLIYRVLVPLVPRFREPIGCSSPSPEDWQFD